MKKLQMLLENQCGANQTLLLATATSWEIRQIGFSKLARMVVSGLGEKAFLEELTEETYEYYGIREYYRCGNIRLVREKQDPARLNVDCVYNPPLGLCGYALFSMRVKNHEEGLMFKAHQQGKFESIFLAL